MLFLRKRLLRPFLLGLALLMTASATWAFKDFVAPKPESADTYPSKDAHPTEKVTAAVDAYNTAPKDEIFGTKYVQEGILPVCSSSRTAATSQSH